MTGPDAAGTDAAHRGGHVIVCGLKGLGLRTVEQLRSSGVVVVVVDDDPDPRLARIVEGWGIPHVHRSATLDDGLADAGLDRAAAVICVEPNELVTLEIAMRVREARPDVRLVVQLANPAVGRALERVSGPGSVVDVAALAAPSFVEACLRRPSHRMELAGEEFVAVQVTVDDGAGAGHTLRSRYGQLAPVAVVPSGGGPMARCPGRDHPVRAGDRVTVLGTPTELEDAGIPPDHDPRPARTSSPWAAGLRRRLSLPARDGARGLALALGALAALVVVATMVIRLAYVEPATGGHPTLLTSAYYTVETLSTVGFGDYSFGRQGAWLEAFAIAFIVLGVSLVTVAFALFTNLLVSRGIERSLGRRQVPGMAGHVVVVGLGSVGIRVVEGLEAAGRRTVVVEQDPANRYLDRARALGVPVVVGDATQRQTHSLANLADASAVAVLTSADLTNVETGLAVRESLGDRWPGVPVVLRVFDRNLAAVMERNFGFEHVRSTSALAAPRIVGSALGLDVLETFYVDRQPFLLGRLPIASGGGLQGLAMQDLSASTRVVALRRAGGHLEHPPRRGTRFAGGDDAYLVGPYEELLRVLQLDQSPR